MTPVRRDPSKPARNTLSPAVRGYAGLNLPPELGARLDAYVLAHGLRTNGQLSRPRGVEHLLDAVTAGLPSPDAIPVGLTWSELRTVIIDEVGVKTISPAKLDTALRKLGMP